MAETFRIEIPISVTDNTDPGISQATKKMTAFDRQNKKTQERLENMNRTKYQVALEALDKVSPIVRHIGSVVKGVAGKTWRITLSVIDKATGLIRSIMSGLKSALGMLGVSVKDGIIVSIKMYMEQQNIETQFEVLLGSAEAAKARMEELTTFAGTTPYISKDIYEASRVLQALTGDALSTGDGLRMVGDIAAGTGENLNDVALWVGQLYSAMKSGKAVDLVTKSLQEMGAISGETRAKIENLADSGLDISQTWPLVIEEFSRFDGMMEKLSGDLPNLLLGVKSFFTDNIFKRLGAGLGQGITPILQKFRQWRSENSKLINEWGENLENSVREWTEKAAEKIGDFVKDSADLFSDQEFRDADLFRKLEIAWDKVIAEPFSKWWSSTGKEWFAGIAGGIGKGIGSGITTGLLVLLGIDISEITEDGINIGGAFVQGFRDGFDTGKITEALVTWVNNHKLIAIGLGVILGGKLISGIAQGISNGKELLDILLSKGKGSNDTTPGTGGPLGKPSGYVTTTMNVRATIVNVYGSVSGGTGKGTGTGTGTGTGKGTGKGKGTGTAKGTGTGIGIGKGIPSKIAGLLGSGLPSKIAAFLGFGGSPTRSNIFGGSPTGSNIFGTSGLPGKIAAFLGFGGSPTGSNLLGTTSASGTADLVGQAGQLDLLTPVGETASQITDIGKSVGEMTENLDMSRELRPLGNLASKIGNVINKIGSGASTVLKRVPVLGTALTLGTAAMDVAEAEDKKEAVFTNAGSILGGIGGGIAGGAALGAAGGAAFGPVGLAIGGAIGAIGGGIGGAIGGEAFTTWLYEQNDKIREVFDETWEKVEEGAAIAGQWIGEKFTTATEWLYEQNEKIREVFDETWENVKEKATIAGEWIGEKFTTAKDAVSTAWSEVSEWFSTNVWEPLKSGATGALSWAKEQLEEIGGKAKNLWDKYLGSGEVDSDGVVSALVGENAWGGIMTKPHMGIVAEDGAEAIIPLSPSKRARGIDLWEQTGRSLGVIPYADGGIVGDMPEDTISVMPATAKTPGTVNTFQIQVETHPEFVIQGDDVDEESIMAMIKARIREMTDDIGDELAERLARIYDNMPIKGGV